MCAPINPTAVMNFKWHTNHSLPTQHRPTDIIFMFNESYTFNGMCDANYIRCLAATAIVPGPYLQFVRFFVNYYLFRHETD